MNNTLTDASVFLVQTIFQLYLLVVMLRFILQTMGANFYNPVSQFTLKLTNPLVTPLRRVLPKLGKVDMAVLLILILLQMIALTLIAWLKVDTVPNIIGLVIWSLGDLLSLLINVFFYAILIMVIISWINPGLHSPVTEILYQLTEPLLRPARRLLPPIGGFDLSPLVVIVILQLLSMVFIKQLTQIGMSLALAN